VELSTLFAIFEGLIWGAVFGGNGSGLMTDSLLSETIAALVCDDPRRAHIFEDHRIDYSYAGERVLSSVLAEPGRDSGRVLADLQSLPERGGEAELDWREATVDDLIENIITEHHDYTRSVLPELSRLMAKVIRSHGRSHPELEAIGEVFIDFVGELERHMEREERSLFPMAREIARTAGGESTIEDSVARIQVVHAEHEVAGRTFHAMRQLSANYQLPEEACVDYRDLFEGFQRLERNMQAHVHKENNILFPALAAKVKKL
jgi:regulator of cell morphogenesis and NO signaling